MVLLHIPKAILFIVIGIIGGGIGWLSFQNLSRQFAKLDQASAREFMLIFLAPTIFAEGYGSQVQEILFAHHVHPTFPQRSWWPT